MANNVLKVKRTSVSGRTPNTTGSYVTNSQYISAGELALNMVDGILYSSNGSAVIEIGANNTNQRITNSLTINNDRNLNFATVNTSAAVRFIQQNDDNFVMYSTNATYGARPVFSIFANSDTSALGFGVPVNFSGANINIGTSTLFANGTAGVAGQVLTSDGTKAYWTAVSGSGSTNVNAQYVWSNLHTFSANVSFTGNGIGIATNTGAIYLGGIADANWKIGRNTGVTTKWRYTNNTIDIVTANSNLEGFTIGLVSGNSYFETGYLGTFIASNVTIGNATSNSTINSTAFATTGVTANTSGVYPASNTSGTALGSTTQRWVINANTINGSGDATITGNTGIGASAQNYTKLYTYTSVTSDSSTYNQYSYHQDNNTALTASRTRYGVYSDLINFSQNKNVDGVTTYSSNYRAVIGDVTNGSSGSGGDARAGEMIGGNFRIYNYANGVNANTISNAKGVQGQVYSYGSGVITAAYGSITYVAIGNTTATGNITTAYGYYSEISSNTAATIGTGYLFYGRHEGSTTTSKFGVYVTGESNNYFSSNVTIAGSIRMISANNIANADFRVINSTANVFYAAANGNLGVATVSPTFKLQVNGSFAATTKSFVIDHPTQEGKFLRYGSLEGPENGVYVRGRLTSESIIHLPKYWWNLVDERTITVNLTPYGKSQDIWVQSVSAYHINLNQPADCFYTVFAERKDIDKLVVEF